VLVSLVRSVRLRAVGAASCW